MSRWRPISGALPILIWASSSSSRRWRRWAFPNCATAKRNAAGASSLRLRHRQPRWRSALGALAWWDLFHRQHVDYYVEKLRRNGIWEGVDHLSAQQAAHRHTSYRFTRHGRLSPPARVDAVNGSGGCTEGLTNVLGATLNNPFVPLPDPYCSVLFTYAGDGSIRDESLLNRLGATKESLTYTAPDIAQITQQGFDAPSKGGGVRFVQFTRDRGGLDQSIRFLYARGVPRPNQDHHYGYRLAYDGASRLVSRSVLDDQGNETGEVLRYRHSPEGFLIEERSEDGQGRPRINPLGFATRVVENDAFGNGIGERYLAPDGSLVRNGKGYASVSSGHDDHGNITRICYFDEAAQPASGDNGTACTGMQHDEQGRVTQADFLDAAGKRMKGQGGMAGFAVQYAADGRAIDSQLLGENGQPAENDEGIAGAHIDYDARGNSINRDFFDAAGKPVLSSVGAHVQMKFDERDNQIEFLILDIAGKPYLPVGGPSYSVRRTLYDERGNMKEIRFLGADLQPIMTRRGYATVRFARDEFGNAVENRMLDVSGRPVRDIDGVSIYRYRFDRLGREIEVTYFDEHDVPVIHRQRASYGSQSEFDGQDREITVRYLDAQGQPMHIPSLGFAGIRNGYDPQGRVIEVNYLDVKGEPVRNGAVSRLAYKRDIYGNELERRYYDDSGALTPFPASGCAIEASEYDRTNSLVGERCLDAAEKPANRRNGGWSVKRLTLEHGRVIGEAYFDAAGKPVKPKT